jgi:hypothetical protein
MPQRLVQTPFTSSNATTTLGFKPSAKFNQQFNHQRNGRQYPVSIPFMYQYDERYDYCEGQGQGQKVTDTYACSKTPFVMVQDTTDKYAAFKPEEQQW